MWALRFKNGTIDVGQKKNLQYVRAALEMCSDGYTTKRNGLCGISCEGNGRGCVVGDKYEHNGTAIGTVFYVDSSKVKIVALKGINSSAQEATDTVYWGSDYYDIPNLVNYEPTYAVEDMDGKNNTHEILSYATSNGKTIPAITAVSKYAPSACSSDSVCGVGKWYLPSLGELKELYEKKYLLVGTEFSTSTFHWSSTERNELQMNALFFGSGENHSYNKDTLGYVRPVLEITK